MQLGLFERLSMWKSFRNSAWVLFFLSPFVIVLIWAWAKVQPVPFSAVGWKSGDEWLRGRMAKSDTMQEVLMGLPETEMISLLGEPDFRYVTDSAPTESVMYFWVRSDYSIAGSSLVVTLRDGLVVKVRFQQSDS